MNKTIFARFFGCGDGSGLGGAPVVGGLRRWRRRWRLRTWTGTIHIASAAIRHIDCGRRLLLRVAQLGAHCACGARRHLSNHVLLVLIGECSESRLVVIGQALPPFTQNFGYIPVFQCWISLFDDAAVSFAEEQKGIHWAATHGRGSRPSRRRLIIGVRIHYRVKLAYFFLSFKKTRFSVSFLPVWL